MSRQNENCPHAVFWRIEKVRKAENYRATSRRPEKCRAASRKRETEFLAENLGLVCNTDDEQQTRAAGGEEVASFDIERWHRKVFRLLVI
jgi:hypothetical protein